MQRHGQSQAGQNSNKKKGGHEFPSLDEELLAIDSISVGHGQGGCPTPLSI